MKAKKSHIIISKGDLVHYCPADMKSEHHDIGIIYDVCEEQVSITYKVKIYKIFWSRSKDYDEYPESGFYNRLKMKIRDKHVFKIINQNE